jgi:hypothetical protein
MNIRVRERAHSCVLVYVYTHVGVCSCLHVCTCLYLSPNDRLCELLIHAFPGVPHATHTKGFTTQKLNFKTGICAQHVSAYLATIGCI